MKLFSLFGISIFFISTCYSSEFDERLKVIKKDGFREVKLHPGTRHGMGRYYSFVKKDKGVTKEIFIRRTKIDNLDYSNTNYIVDFSDNVNKSEKEKALLESVGKIQKYSGFLLTNHSCISGVITQAFIGNTSPERKFLKVMIQLDKMDIILGGVRKRGSRMPLTLIPFSKLSEFFLYVDSSSHDEKEMKEVKDSFLNVGNKISKDLTREDSFRVFDCRSSK